MKKNRYFTGTLCAILLFLISGYLLLDTFAISRSYTAVSADNNETAFSAALKNIEEDVSSESNEQAESSDTVISESVSVIVDGSSSDSASDAGMRRTSRSGGHSGKNSRSSGNSKKGFGSSSSSTEASSSSSQIAPVSSASGYQTYSDENITIELNAYTVNDTAVYVADVQVSSAAYLKTAFANGVYGKNITEKTSDMAEENNAVLAVNGDYYGAQETGYVIRNGVVYRSTSRSDTDILCIYADGSMQIRNTGDISAQELVDEGVWQAFSFGPSLVENGAVTVDTSSEVGRAMTSNPRTAIGIIDENHYLFVVSDGRTDESEGLSLYELAAFMQSLGATTAYNLDGGGSSTMWYLGEVINNPTTSGTIKEREVSDIVYIG